jgi:hypothetical protein
MEFLQKHTKIVSIIKTKSYFVIENDDYIITFLNSMSVLNTASSDYTERLLLVKFEEIMLYLLTLQIQRKFEFYLYSLISKEVSPFKK